LNGERIGDIKKGFAAACERAGLRGVTPHTPKHTAATWPMQAGTDPWQLVEQVTEPGFETSISASVTGTSSGQSSVTVQMVGSSATGRRARRARGRA
jgi:hypothetical protein